MAEIIDTSSSGVGGTAPATDDGPKWIKSTLNLSEDAEDEDMSNQPYRKEAKEQFTKIAKDWPEGELSEGAYGDDTGDSSLHIQYLFQPAETGPFGFIEIDLYINQPEIDQSFAMWKKDCLTPKTWREEGKQVDGYVDWPAGFPDQNDYENVSHCGATKDLSKVMWAQNNTLVQLGCMEGGKTLKEYADGVWQVVNGMGL